MALEHQEGRRIRVLIVDDHRLFAEAVAPYLEAQEMSVLGVATSGRDGLHAARTGRPDIVLLDLALPDVDGLIVGRQILEELPATRIIALTAVKDPRAVKQAVVAGFSGYITKEIRVRQLAELIRAVLDGQIVFPQRLARVVAEGRSAEERQAALLAEQLTARERQVLALLAEGLNGWEIGRSLSISANTVRTHIHSVLTKLQVHSRLEAVAFATKHGILKRP